MISHLLLPLIFPVFLALPLAVLTFSLVADERDSRPWPLQVAGFVSIWIFIFAALYFFWPPFYFKDDVFPPALNERRLLIKLGASVLLGAASLALAATSSRLKAFALGVALGLAFFLFGLTTREWIPVLICLKMLGSFWGPAFQAVFPLLLAACFGAASWLILHPDSRRHSPVLLAAALAPALFGAILSQGWLATHWDYGPPDLVQAAGLSLSVPVQTLLIADLRPHENFSYRVEEREAIVDGISATAGNLVALYKYLRKRQGQTIFARKALKILRKGWTFWWDEDRGLAAAMIYYPDRAVPDYQGALALLSAGPITMERFQKLQALSRIAQSDDRGIEDISRAQAVFEAFESAYARFGDSGGARYWLRRLQNLQLVAMRKLQIHPLEPYIKGTISGQVRVIGNQSRSPGSFIIGLFFVSSGTTGDFLEGTLSETAFPDASGRYVFKYLGPGRYYLGLMGTPLLADARIAGAPGLVELSERKSALVLKPILLSTTSLRPEPQPLKPFDLLFGPP